MWFSDILAGKVMAVDLEFPCFPSNQAGVVCAEEKAMSKIQ